MKNLFNIKIIKNMNNGRSNLIFLAVGLTLGAAVGYVLSSDKVKKEKWMQGANDLVGRVRNAVCKDNCRDEEVADDAK